METLGAIYVIVTSLIGTALLLILAGIAVMEIWEEIQNRRWLNQVEKKFHDSPTG